MTVDTMPGANGAGPATSRLIDLDAAAAGRAEAQGDPVILRFRGQDFELPVEMPVDFALFANDGRIRECIEVLLGDQADTFFALRPSVADFQVLAEQASAVYGIDQGKSQASSSA